MRTLTLLLLMASTVHGQTVDTYYYHLSMDAPPRLVSTNSRPTDRGFIYIETGDSRAVLQTFPAQHEWRIYPGGGFSPYRSHFMGRGYRW